MAIYSHVKSPNFFILGAPKAGTTALGQYLSEHPDVFFSYPKEPNYFNTDFSSKYRLHHNLASYLNTCFYESADFPMRGEGTVWYLYSTEAVANILKQQPDARFIVMLRNPVEMAYALHATLYRSRINEDVSDFETAWKLQDKRKQGLQLPKDIREPKVVQYRDVCMIGAQVERLLRQVDKENVLFIFFDDFKADPQSIYEKACNFLSLKNDGRTDFPVVNQNQDIRFGGLSKMINKMGRSSKIIEMKRKLGIPKGKSLLGLLDKMNRKKVERKPLDSKFKNDLTESFLDDIILLESLLNRNLSHWK
jgi:hypothetical protein